MTLLLAVALTIIILRDLFASAMLSGIFSLISAGLFTVMDAVDVAFTEAAVGAGISTVLMLSALLLTTSREKHGTSRLQPLPLLVVVLTGGALIYGTLDMPLYGDPAAPVHQHVGTTYLERTPHEIGVPNVVTAVLASYRGYDTLGETTVVFIAGTGVLLLLKRPRGGKQKEASA